MITRDKRSYFFMQKNHLAGISLILIIERRIFISFSKYGRRKTDHQERGIPSSIWEKIGSPQHRICVALFSTRLDQIVVHSQSPEDHFHRGNSFRVDPSFQVYIPARKNHSIAVILLPAGDRSPTLFHLDSRSGCFDNINHRLIISFLESYSSFFFNY